MLDVETRKILTINKIFYKNKMFPRMYLLRREGGSVLMKLNQVYRATSVGLAEYVKCSTDYRIQLEKQTWTQQTGKSIPNSPFKGFPKTGVNRTYHAGKWNSNKYRPNNFSCLIQKDQRDQTAEKEISAKLHKQLVLFLRRGELLHLTPWMVNRCEEVSGPYADLIAVTCEVEKVTSSYSAVRQSYSGTCFGALAAFMVP